MNISINRNALAHILGICGLYILSVSAWTFTIGVDIGLVLMLLGTLIKPDLYPVIWRQGMGRVLMILTLYILASAIWAAFEFPSTFRPQTTAIYRWSKLLLLFLPAWWLSLDETALKKVYWLSLAGFLLMIAFNANWSDMIRFEIGLERPGFGLADPNETAMPCALYLFSLAIFAPRLIQNKIEAKWFWSWLAIGGIAFWMLSFVILATLSRQAWLALAILSPLLLGIRYFVLLKQQKVRYKYFALIILPLVIVIAFSARNIQPLKERAGAESSQVSALGQHDKMADSATSIGSRINMIKFGFDKWLARPIFGWGIGSSQYVFRTSEDQRMVATDFYTGSKGYFLNMHNTYTEILLRMGIVGALAWFGLFTIVMRLLVQEYRSAIIPLDTFLFLLGMGLMMLILGWFSFYVGNNRGCVYWLLFAGSVYSLRLRQLHLPLSYASSRHE